VSSTRSGAATPAIVPAAVAAVPVRIDLMALRERARRNMGDGAVTEGYAADRHAVLQLLDAALATELVCVLRYKRHYFMAKGQGAEDIAQEFFEHAAEEQGHADAIAERIVQLGGEPDFAPQGLAARSHAEYRPGTDVGSMIEADLVAERIAIESYREMVQFLGNFDPTTRRLVEAILATEETHAAEFAGLLRAAGRSSASA
jgi:bacterioferritin